MAIIDQRNRSVGLDFSYCDATEAIIKAIKHDNENVVVTRLPGYIKVKSLNKLMIYRETVEEYLGNVWQTDKLQLVATSYYGFMGDWDKDKIVIQWDNV
ncbi:MmoB/DmpM family protein [Bacillus sp. EB600]|uniref:MmoB/DmpM family protein n=1 Tax=Bacillus sp. EB600 TaxID=2806345 RepID=UPI002108B321|nr:MmoB/DmpM family protein [Bacillus sp. EB600]MCQ6279489.1 MmoB/DmpM family protein [Bacillus sp. EB600]